MLNQLNAAPKAPKCACCNNTSAGLVWEIPVCQDCFAEWIRDDRFNNTVINAFLGVSDKPEDFTKANHERYCAESKKRTAAWVLERTKRAA